MVGQLTEPVSVKPPKHVKGMPNDLSRPLPKSRGIRALCERPRAYHELPPMGGEQGRAHGAVDPCLERFREERLALAHEGERITVEHELLQLHGRDVP